MATRRPLIVNRATARESEMPTGDTVPTDALGSGTASATTFLRGDGVWGTAALLTANTFTGLQTFNAGVNGGLTGGVGDALKSIASVIFPRSADFGGINQDYQDEFALAHLNPAWTITGTSNAVAFTGGPLQALFIDNSDSFFTNSATNTFPVVVTVDTGAAPIPASGNGYFRLGLTFRGNTTPTSILVEAWTGTAYVTAVNATGLTAADFHNGQFWLSAQFGGNITTANMDRVRVTLGGTNPTAAAFFWQRMILYHATAPLNPWNLHKLGGVMYGNANWQIGAPQVAGLNVWHPGNLTPGATMPVRTVTTNYTVLLSDGVIFVDATAGAVTVTLPTAASAIVGGQGQRVRVKKIDVTANAVTITATGGQIDGATNAVISVPYNAFEFSPIPATANWGGF